MKTGFIVLLILVLTTFCSFSQGSELDSGFEMLRIDKKKVELSKYLIETPQDSFWDNTKELMGDFITSAYIFDHKKAGLKTFFGMEIDRIELFFDGEYDEHGNAQQEDVYSFSIFLKKSGDVDDIAIEMMERYGDSVPWIDPESSELIRMDWFSEITLLVVTFGYDMETDMILPYFKADFSQAYGG